MHINNDGACIVGEGKIPANFFIGRLSSNDLIGIDSLISLIPDSSHGEVSVNADEVNRPSFHFLLTKIQGDYYSSLVSGTGNSNYLAEILKRLQNIKKGLKLNKVDTVYTFGSNILTPPPPPPISKKDEY